MKPAETGKPEQQAGYCTDVWFANAAKFIEQHKDGPFFCYIATNAPHSPYNVDKKYSQPYVERGVPQPMANFYGMIENIEFGDLTIFNKDAGGEYTAVKPPKVPSAHKEAP